MNSTNRSRIPVEEKFLEQYVTVFRVSLVWVRREAIPRGSAQSPAHCDRSQGETEKHSVAQRNLA